MKKIKLTKLIASLIVIGSVFTLNPIAASAEWKGDNSGWWYEDGSTWATGWKLLDGKWYYFDSDGVMQTGWQKIKGVWYYLGGSSDGAMKTGWQKINGKWYYLNPEGDMKTGWLYDKNIWYYLNNDGSMAVNCSQDGWYLGADGAGRKE